MNSDRIKADGYFGAFGDAYNLLKGIPDDRSQMNLEFWQKFTLESRDIARKYEGTPAAGLARELVTSVMAEVERIYYL